MTHDVALSPTSIFILTLEQILASDICYQLASALHSMAAASPYEDVQAAATLIAQCATNVMTVSRSPTMLDGTITSAL